MKEKKEKKEEAEAEQGVEKEEKKKTKKEKKPEKVAELTPKRTSLGDTATIKRLMDDAAIWVRMAPSTSLTWRVCSPLNSNANTRSQAIVVAPAGRSSWTRMKVTGTSRTRRCPT